MTDWEVVIGLEIHAQLATKSKIFSGSATAYGAPPNTQANLVDLAYPGVLPVLNAEAVRMAVKFGLSIGASVALGLARRGASVVINGRELPNRRPRESRKIIQMVFQDPYGSLHPNQTVDQTLSAPIAIHRLGNAEATAISARGKALGDNPHLVTLVQAEKWNGVLPVTMVPGGTVPMITLGK